MGKLILFYKVNRLSSLPAVTLSPSTYKNHSGGIGFLSTCSLQMDQDMIV